jgi:exosome complex RNA-binding protein Rrp42 (RNase PH superfamily)
VKLEIAVVTDDGGLVDAVLNAGIAALMDMRKPMVQM